MCVGVCGNVAICTNTEIAWKTCFCVFAWGLSNWSLLCSHVDGKILQSRRNQALRKCQWYCELNKRLIFNLCQWCASRRSMRTIWMSPNRAKLSFFCKTQRHIEFPMHVFFLNLRFLPPKSKSLWSGFYAGLASNLCDTRHAILELLLAAGWGTKRVFKPFAKSSQSSQAHLLRHLLPIYTSSSTSPVGCWNSSSQGHSTHRRFGGLLGERMDVVGM